MTTAGNRRIDRILDPSFLEGIGEAPLDTLREKRDECDEEEAVLSYERSLIHSRLRILNDEVERRASGAPPKSLVERLPEILADTEIKHRGAFPKLDAPPFYDNPRRRVEKLITNDTLLQLGELTEEQIGTAVTALDQAEGEVSESRKAVHAVLDRVIEEIAKRKTGADV